MTNSEIRSSEDEQNNWQLQNYMRGSLIGLTFGVLAAYLYNRAAEEDAERNGGKPAPVQTMQLISLTLAALGLIRQIAELGKSPKSSKK